VIILFYFKSQEKMSVDYNKFAKTFSKSRKNMKWEEIDYFLDLIDDIKNKKILDIWCGSWRFLSHLKNYIFKWDSFEEQNYLWVDLSEWLLDQAKLEYKEANFLQLNMLDIDKLEHKFDYIFFIASFHHLDNLYDRLEVLKKAYNLLNEWWKIFMTNWALNSELNSERYKSSIIENSKNKFWSLDYNIKIWVYKRYYHCFDLSELNFLFDKAWFKFIENRLFDNKRNFISIIEKNWD